MPETKPKPRPREELERAIAALELQRAVLGDEVVNLALAPLRAQLAELDRSHSPMTAERRLVTIMFADIAGFTSLAEKMDPEQVHNLINDCFSCLLPSVEKYGGTVDKLIGDAVMALFGAPVTHENDAERALRTALEMMNALEAFNRAHNTDLGLHVGINTGLVIAGEVGSQNRHEYSVIGDAVNIASRLEDLSRRGEIIVGPDTYRLTSARFKFEPLPPVKVKGRTEKIPAYRLLGPSPSPTSRGIPGLASSLVGREKEQTALNRAIANTIAGQGGLVTIIGEAGLGKSRLVAESRRHRTNNPDDRRPRWLEGRCLSYTASASYALWQDLLRNLLPPNPTSTALYDLIRDLCPSNVEQTYPYLARLLSLPPENHTQAWETEGEDLKTGIFSAVKNLLRCLAQPRPLIVVLEDLHWASSTSLELLTSLFPLVEQLPLLLICIFRPEPGHDCRNVEQIATDKYGSRHTSIHLTPLQADETTALIDNLLHVADLPPLLRQRIISRAEGNPFFVEEIIRSLIDDQILVHDETEGRWKATRDLTDITIPNTINGVLMARIDRLPGDTILVLRTAAVIGRIFSHSLLAALVPQDPAEHLRLLQQEGMIREREPPSDREYIFKHQLTQEAAYQSILRKERTLLHRRIAEALERLFPDRLDEYVELLAHHWKQAGVEEKAIEYLLRAGDKARLAYAHKEAIDYYERALPILRRRQEHARAARTLMKLGLTYHNAFDFARSRRAYEEGFALWQQAGETLPYSSETAETYTLRVGWWNPTTLDPSMVNDLYSINVIDQLFDGLVELTPEMEIIPCVARSWQPSEGGRRYTFHLKDDVRWSDGHPVTAGDFEYAWKRVLNPAVGSPGAEMLYDIKGAGPFHREENDDPATVGVKATDPYTLIVELENPIGYFLQLLTQPLTRPLPRHILERYGDDWTAIEHIVTNGPFLIKKWEQNRLIRLIRNPDYHGRFEGNLSRVELRLSPDPLELLDMYRRDELDLLNLGVLPPEQRDDARRRHVGEYTIAPVLSVMYVGFNTSHHPFDDPLIRRAFALAIDREKLAGIIVHGYISPAAGGFIPPGMPGHVADLGSPCDPERARRLLAEAGYPNGHRTAPLRLICFRGLEPVAEFLTSYWQRALGVKVDRETLEYHRFAQEIDAGRMDIFISGWTADYPDPDNFLRICPFRRDTRWQNDLYDSLVEQARRTMDTTARLELYRRAETIIAREAIIIPLAYSWTHMLLKPWVRKLPTTANKYWFWKNVIVEPASDSVTRPTS